MSDGAPRLVAWRRRDAVRLRLTSAHLDIIGRCRDPAMRRIAVDVAGVAPPRRRAVSELVACRYLVWFDRTTIDVEGREVDAELYVVTPRGLRAVRAYDEAHAKK